MSALPSFNRDRNRDARALNARGPERRRNARSGRRSADPHVSAWRWRRIAWLFATYVAFISLRSLPSAVRKWLQPSQRV